MTPLVPALIYRKTDYKNYLLLLIICLLAYWPITFNIFSSKGDSLHYFLPYRYNISEAIQHGELPFWSPYIYSGNPIYGDMQSGAWNPFVWFFSLFGSYDLTVFHIEYLVYIFLAGIGMYRLVKFLYKDPNSGLLLATAYMLSGALLAGQVISWAASAAFLPFLIHFYLVLIKTHRWSAAWKTGLCLYLLLVCGYPSYFILISYLLLLLVFISLFDRFAKKKYALPITWGKFILQHLLIIVTFIGLSLPAIISYADLLPYYSRGTGVTYLDSLANTFEFQHFLSFIFPPTTGAPYFYSETDMTSRNIYFGILSMVVFAAYPPKLTRRNILLICLILFSVLFSLGGATPLRKLCYDFVPLMNTFRHPAQTRLFFIFGLLLLMAPGIKSFLESVCEKKDYSKGKNIKLISFSLAALLVLAVVISFPKAQLLKSGISVSGGFNKLIKTIMDTFRFYDAVFVSAIIQLVSILVFLVLFLRKRLTTKKFYWLWTINLFIMAQLVLPITFVSQINPKEINRFILDNKNNYGPDRLNRPIEENSRDIARVYDRSELDLGLSNFYKKTISITHVTYSPSFLTELDPVFSNEAIYNFIAAHPAVYITDLVIKTKDSSILNDNSNGNFVISDELPIIITSSGNEHAAEIKKLGSNRVEITAHNKNDAYLVLTQSYHHHWKVWVDGKREKIYKANIAFMAVPLTPGDHQIVFKFIPTNTINALWIMLATIVLLIIAGIITFIRQNNSRQSV